MGSVGHYIGTDWSWKGNTREYLDKQHTSDYGGTSWRVLASETRGSVYYAAIERINAACERIVFAVVQPYSFYGKGYNRVLMVKGQDETCGPYDVECSTKILDLLTETDSEYAQQWREKARAWNAQRKAEKKSGVKIEVGDILVFETEISFAHWGSASRFKVSEWGRRKRLWALTDEGNARFPCRLRRDTLKYLKHEVIKGAAL